MLGNKLDPEIAHQAQKIVAFSLGYFIHDSLDMAVKQVYCNSVGVWIHHILVIGCFLGSIIFDKYGVYLVFNLIVEINNVFIHQRKLMLLLETGFNWVYKLNLDILFVTFSVFRFGGNGFILYKVVMDYYLFLEESYGFACWCLAFIGMLLLNVYNVIFYIDLKKSEARLLKDAKRKE